VTGLNNILVSAVGSNTLHSNCQRAAQGDDPSFVRVLLLRGRMVGAVLIGETELEETFENLILDQLDLTGLGPALLDPDIELDHVFD
jgi:NAD(P)H-nitrite reductase large subunit